MSIISTLAKGTAWMLISAVVVKFSGWMYYVIIARLVTPEEIGMFYLAFSIISMIVIFSNLGLGSSTVVRYVPYYAGKRYFNHIREVVKISALFGTVFSTICFLLVIIFAKNLSDLLQNESLVPILYITASYLFISNLYSITVAFLQGRKRLKFASHITSLQGVGKLILTVTILFTLGFNAQSIAYGFILSFLLASVIGVYWATKEYRLLPLSNDVPYRMSLLKEMIPFGLTFVAISSVWNIITYTDRIMLGYFLPPEESMALIGIYSIVVGFCMFITIFVGCIGAITIPLMSESYGRGDSSEMRDIAGITIRWIVLATFPILLMILSFPKQILGVIYGPQYVVGYLTFMIYACGTSILVLSSPSQYILEAIRRLDVSMGIFASGAILNVTLNYLLIPTYRIEGAAFASATTYLLVTILLSISANRFIKTDFPDISRILMSGVITVVILFMLKPYVVWVVSEFGNTLFSDSDVLAKVFKFFILGLFTVITTIIYIALLTLLKSFVKEDVEILTGAMRRVNMPKNLIAFTQRILLR